MCFIIIVQNVEQTFNQINNMKNLKTIFACLLMAVLSIGQVWAEDVTFTFPSSSDLLGWSADPSPTSFESASPSRGLAWSKKAMSMTYTLDGYGISHVKVVASTNNAGNYTLSVNGGTGQAVTKDNNKDYDFDVEVADGGTVTISTTYTGSGKSFWIKSIVFTKASSGGTVAVTGVELDEDAITLNEEETQTLTATVSPDNATNKNVTWESDDESVATVSNGVVTAVGAGDATITCKSAADATKHAECVVHVNASPYTKSKLIFTAACGGSGTADDDAEWAVTSDGNESNFDNVRGIHYGTGSASVQYVQLTTSDISGTIAKVVVNASDATGTAEISVSVGGTDFTCSGSTTVTNSNPGVDYTFTGSASGEIVVRIDRGSSMTKAIYVKSVIVSYIPAPQKQNTGLAYSVANYLVKAGASLATPELTNPNSLEGITYASSDADVVAVNETTGALTIKAAGKAVINASRAEDETYKAGSASYTIYVATEAGTAGDPLTEASAKALIDLGCEMEVHVHGTVLGSQDATKFTVTLAGGMQFYKLKDLGNVAFESAYIKNGDEVTAIGTLTKYNTTYELAEGCYLTAYTEYTEPLVDISNTKETAYTVAQALALATNPTSDLTKAVYIAGVVYDVKSFNSTNGTLDIYIKDEGVENKFEFYKCAGIYDESLTEFAAADDVQVGDEVIGYGVMKYFSGGSIWEFDNTATGDYLVELTRPAVAVTGIDLTESTAEVEVGSTVTLHASVVPGNATDQGIEWSVTSGSDKASVDENGVVTGTAAGEAVIRAASHEDASIYEECTVTVTAVDPTKHTVTFDATIDISDQETSITKSGITITASKFNNNEEGKYYYQCYASSAMTVSSTVGNITNIELTCTASGTAKYGPGNWDFTGYSYSGANGSWTGSAETVEFGNASQQVRMTLITVTYKEDNREAAGLAWNPADDIEITVGDAFSAPALQNPNNIDAAEISIESSNTSLATVTAGEVSLVADATGTATITATFAGNDDYKPATISYNITVNEAGLDNVTFDSSEDHAESGETTITKSGFTLSFTSGTMDGTQAEYRLYKSQTMTLSSTDYLIKKIEFTCTSGNPITGFADATGLDKDNNEWTGESNTVELTASNAQVRMTKIKVFYVEDTRAAAGLAWNPADDIELTVGDAFSAPALLNPNSIDAAEISIESSNTDVATVTAGVVALVADATGEATITATFAGNASYKPATVSYKITVNPAYSIYVQPSLNVNFGSVNQNAEVADKSITVTLTGVDAATLTLEGTGASAFTISPYAALTASGDITISASSANIGTFVATLTISDDANNAESKVVNISITVNEVVTPETPVSTTSKWVPATEIADGMQVLIVGVNNTDYYAMGAQTNNNRTAVQGAIDGEGVFTPGENTMAFTVVAQEGGTYALQASNGKYLYAASSGSNWLRSQDVLDDNGKWTLSVTSAVANGTYTHKMMQFNSGSSIFACYTTSTITQKPIALYVPKPAPAPEYETVRSGLEINRYYTVCLPKKVTAIKGASFWTLNNKSQDGATAYLEEETNNLPFAAGKPFIIQATAEKLEVVYEGDATEVAGTNGALHGTLVYMSAAALDAAGGSDVYMLYENALRPVGDNNHLEANRAYVKLNELDAVAEAPQSAPGRRVRAMPMQPQTATGIEDLNASEKPMKMMINGQIFILRGEKMYDTTGRLVK